MANGAKVRRITASTVGGIPADKSGEEGEMYLTDHYNRNLDAKARLTLPADFRKQFDDKVCLVPYNGALCGFTPEGHQAWLTSFFPDGFDPKDRKQYNLRRMITSNTTTLDIDSAGRVALGKVNDQIIEKLELGDKLVVVGNVDHFEIFDLSRWEEKQADADEDLDALLFDA